MSTGRDPRRRPSAEERRRAYIRADGKCENCGKPLGADYHNAHMVAWIHGGASAGENIGAWCTDCNLRLGPNDVEGVEGLHFRQWQAAAFPVILRELYHEGSATLHAAPGAGKTLFAVATYAQLRESELAERVVVVVPNLAIVAQWRDAFARLRIHLDIEPRDGYLEHPDTDGCVITYHRLGQPHVAEAHAVQMRKRPTLVIFDEVHHLAEKAVWGNAAEIMAGDVANGKDNIHAAAVLNMTGTLFRSSRTKRISTVKYNKIPTPDGEKWQARADWSIPTAALVGTELRPVDLWSYSSHAEVVDLRNEEVVRGEIADLDKQQLKAVIRGQLDKKSWLKGFAAEALRMLDNQCQFVDEPLKLLFIANSIPAAKRAADAINEIRGHEFARLVVSGEPGPQQVLRAAAREPQSCAIVAVQMVTEGFDCPQVSTIAYATNILADLFVAQMMARAMRVTDYERATGKMLPAQILIPDHGEVRRVFERALKDLPRLVSDDDIDLCPRCGSPRDQCQCPPSAPPMLRYELLELTDPRLDSATVLGHDDGHVAADELAWSISTCQDLGIFEGFAPRFAVGSRRRPIFKRYSKDDGEGKTAVISDDPRSVNRIYRARLKLYAGFMQKHIDHDERFANVGQFQAMANDAAGIPIGGRDQALSNQLAEACAWMRERIIEHVTEHNEPSPAFLQEEDDERRHD